MHFDVSAVFHVREMTSYKRPFSSSFREKFKADTKQDGNLRKIISMLQNLCTGINIPLDCSRITNNLNMFADINIFKQKGRVIETWV